MNSRPITKLLTLGVVLVLVAGCGAPSFRASTRATTSPQSPKTTSTKRTKKSWIPPLADVKQVTIDLDGGDTFGIQLPGPIQIYPTSPRAKALIEKLLHMVTQGKALPQSPNGVPFGEHEFTIYFKDGKMISASQWYGTMLTPLGESVASPSVVGMDFSGAYLDVKGGKYEDPALAQWLADGWYQDTQAISEGWTCTSKTPPNGHPNQILGIFAHGLGAPVGTYIHGRPWAVVGSSKGRCVTFYTLRSGAWSSSIVTKHGPVGTTVEQAQFVDTMHGFVLVGGAPHEEHLPRALYETSDGGVTWHALPNSASLPMTDAHVQMAFLTPTEGWLTTLDKGYTPVKVYAYLTTDGGQNWTVTDFALPPTVEQHASCLSVVVPPVQQGITASLQPYMTPEQFSVQVIGCGLFLFGTNDGGLRWQNYPAGGGP